MRPAIYSAYDKRAKSTVIDEEEVPQVFTSVATASVTNLLNKRGKSQYGYHQRSNTGLSVKSQIERRALMHEFGGFKDKRVLSAFYK